MDTTGTEMRTCLALCLDCERACLTAAAGEGPLDDDRRRVLLDCAQMCRTAADFMVRGSVMHGYTCGLCSHICKVCADVCEPGSAVADICQRCAESCLRMSKAMAEQEYDTLMLA